MGNHSSRSSESSFTLERPRHKKLPRRKWFSDSAPSIPDVETLGLPFSVCHKILLHLDLPDLGSCMLVCKEWRSLIETCSFWNSYRMIHFSHRIVQPRPGSFLSEWNYVRVQTSVKNCEWQNDLDDDSVFYPYPQLWKCGIIAPYRMVPPQGNLDMCHSFLFAAHWLVTLFPVLNDFQIRHKAGLCLFQWRHSRMPSAHEVLQIFNANKIIIQNTEDVTDFSRYEVGNWLEMRPLHGIDLSFLHWVVRRCGERVLAFHVDQSMVSPAPGFLLTHLSTGWVGGLIFACS